MLQGLGDIFKTLKNMGPLKEQMTEAQTRIARLRINGEAGAGMVSVTASGDGRVVDCKIDTNLLEPEEFHMLEDLFISACNDALEKAKEASAYELKSAMGMEGMPDIENLFKDGS